MSQLQKVLIVSLSLILVALFQGVILNRLRDSRLEKDAEGKKSIELLKKSAESALGVKKSVDSMKKIIEVQGVIISTIQKKVDENDKQLKLNVATFKRERLEIEQKLNALQNYQLNYTIE